MEKSTFQRVSSFPDSQFPATGGIFELFLGISKIAVFPIVCLYSPDYQFEASQHECVSD